MWRNRWWCGFYRFLQAYGRALLIAFSILKSETLTFVKGNQFPLWIPTPCYLFRHYYACCLFLRVPPLLFEFSLLLALSLSMLSTFTWAERKCRKYILRLFVSSHLCPQVFGAKVRQLPKYLQRASGNESWAAPSCLSIIRCFIIRYFVRSSHILCFGESLFWSMVAANHSFLIWLSVLCVSRSIPYE